MSQGVAEMVLLDVPPEMAVAVLKRLAPLMTEQFKRPSFHSLQEFGLACYAQGLTDAQVLKEKP